MKRAVERRDDLLEAFEERAWDWHDGFNGGWLAAAISIIIANSVMMSSLHHIPGR